MSRVVHPAVRSPNADTLEVLHRGAGNWAASRARAKATHDWDAMREALPETIVVSVSHRDSVDGHHRQRLELLGAGRWRLTPV